MVRRAKEGKDPWYEEGSPSLKNTDNDIVFFLLCLYDRHSEPSERFPQSQIMRIFNIFSYSRQPGKCMNSHVRSYRANTYRTSDMYESVFVPILRR